MDMSALEMTRMSSMAVKPMEMAGHWTFPYAALVFLMWWIMMIAMMVPSAAPTLLLFTALKRQGQTRDSAALTGGLFLSGYLLAWAGFSLGATLLQWQLGNLGLISATSMTIGSRVLASTVLIIAGLYQFTKLKDACLEHCRSPAHFLARHNRPGLLGAWKMGAHHGAFCLGCCWALMALLFVGGVMNLYWIAGLALYVMAEKLFPFGATLSRLIGAGLIVAGVAVLLL
ncbi:MAG: DUF2182 domain-containing protein [Rhodobacteraceae bacterium]|nr:DUF2182 domain-containing protein [Paracoccaceae bacterium]